MMTEDHWMRCGDTPEHCAYWQALLAHGDAVSERKLRLLACAFARAYWAGFVQEQHRREAVVGELFADGLVTAEELAAAHQAGRRLLGNGAVVASYCTTGKLRTLDARYALHAAATTVAVSPYADNLRTKRAEIARFGELLHDVFGDPFHHISLAPTDRTSTVVSLARTAYDERQLPSGELDPHRLAVLADALEEVGAPGELVAHLRGPGPHVRGCFCIDLILGLA